MVRRDGWRFIDVDDVGLGDPAWDLARPAALFAVGLLDPLVWGRFLDTYRGCGGPAVPATGDPWPALDVVARALVVQMAARAVERTAAGRGGGEPDGGAELDEADRAFVDACARMSSIGSG